jgi:protein-tyrosine phosphatase
LIQLDEESTFAEVTGRAADELSRGHLVAFSTETVYGVAARADLSEAVTRLRAVKARGPDRAFTVHIAAPNDVFAYAPSLPGLAHRLILKAWPGPLTLIVDVDNPSTAPAVAELDRSAVSAIYHKNTIGLRCPDDRVAAAILGSVRAPVVAASANLAGKPPPVTGSEILADLGGKIELIVDSGPTKYARPSTIVRVDASSYKVIREGVYDAGIVRRMTKLRILFVCTGNTCRSPMAEGLAKKMLVDRLGCTVDELPERGVEVSSAGTAGGGGGASDHAVAVMNRRDVSLSDHVSTPLSADQLQQADHIFVMTEGHRDAVLSMEPSVADRVSLLVDGENVRDPVGGSESDYEECARMVEQGLQSRLQEVIV